PTAVETLLKRRGLGSTFVNSEYKTLSSWNSLPGAEKASSILEEAIRKDRLVLVHGDFDADGITSTALAVRVIEALGGRVQYHVPCRFKEGYGLGETGLRKCIEAGVDLLLSVDCGITAIDQVAALKKEGISVVITDHHVPAEKLPEADALVNPELSGDVDFPWRYLSGVGVIHFVLRGLAEKMGKPNIPELEPDLVAIGTVCDMVSLVGDNRILVKRGLNVLRSSPSSGIQALIRASGITQPELSPRDIGFALGPRINSSGRIKHAATAVDLLLETDSRLAEEMASSLDRTNNERKQLDSSVFAEASELLRGTDAAMGVTASDNWHPGVIGISASRLASELNRPVLLISWNGDTGRGSARGVPGMPVYSILSAAMDKGLLLKFGGHAQAAGLTIARSSFEEFKAFTENTAKSTFAEVSKPILYIDGGLDPDGCNGEVLSALGELSPFGEGNPEPVWITRGVYPASFRTVGQHGKHLQVSFQHGSKTLRGIGFSMGHRTSELNRMLDIAFTLSADSWRGGDAVQLVIKDIKP
ncbi:MAG: single-stranded-DNA-specific exonuclease RecJ, partial [bacterium]|nr:single-stranded-DNA-specific exonuclease RecJ [bacterium]